MKLIPLALACLGLATVVAGCNRGDDSLPEPPSAQDLMPSGGDAAADPQESSAAAGDAASEVDLTPLNKVLREYVKATGVIPKDINELVSSGYIPHLPPPPAGKKYRIALHPLGYSVVLENR